MAGKQLHKHIPREERVREEVGEARGVAWAPSASPADCVGRVAQRAAAQARAGDGHAHPPAELCAGM